jgi:aspartate/methionine/tyrosine aminotransferase
MTCAPLAMTIRNVVVTRTFSKAFCLASVRCGYVIAHPATLDELRPFYNPKSVNQLAQVAAAAALREFDSYYQPVHRGHPRGPRRVRGRPREPRHRRPHRRRRQLRLRARARGPHRRAVQAPRGRPHLRARHQRALPRLRAHHDRPRDGSVAEAMHRALAAMLPAERV